MDLSGYQGKEKMYRKSSIRRIVIDAALALAFISTNAQVLGAVQDSILTVTQARRDANGDLIPDLLALRITVGGRANVYSGVIHMDRLVVFLEDDRSGIGLYSTEFGEPIAEGDSIIATGYVEQFEGLTRLTRVSYRRVIVDRPMPMPTPPLIRLAEPDYEMFEGRLVRVEGEVKSKWEDAYGYFLSFRGPSGETDSLVAFLLKRHKNSSDFKEIDAGDRILMTGILIQFARGGRLNSGYEIVPRYPEDIVRLETPTRSYVMILLISGGLVVLSFGWIWMLRRQVSRQTARLRESENKFRSVFQGAKDGMIVLTDDLRIVDANPAACSLYGWTREALLNRPFTELLGRDELPLFVANRDSQEPNMVHEFETTLSRRDAIQIHLHAKMNVVDQGKHRRLILVLRDVTERKQAEEQKRDLEAQIVQMQKIEAIGTLAAGIAHDFNNLLNGVFGYVEMARNNVDRGNYEKVRTYLSKSMNMAESARALTRQLTTFSKGGAPVKSLSTIGPILRDTAGLALAGTALHVEFDFLPELWPCEIDQNQIGQVFSNVVINARQAMPDGGTLFITASNVPANGPLPPALPNKDYVMVRIRDTGPGIPREHLGRIFEPFFTTKPSGHGLGLSTSYSIIKKHEGLITVESEPGTGSTFTIFLPASRGAEAGSEKGEPVSLQGEGKILVLDDEEYMRELASTMLAGMGYTAECASDGGEALEMFQKAISSGHRFDLVLLDLTIPGGMGGREVLQKMLAIDSSAKGIASSGYSDDEVMASPDRFGFADKLQKPYSTAELGAVVRRALLT
jgi:PAS domain S-box-containing protein